MHKKPPIHYAAPNTQAGFDAPRRQEIPVYFGTICHFLPDSIDFSPKKSVYYSQSTVRCAQCTARTGRYCYARFPGKRRHPAVLRAPALQRRTAHCGLHSCRCKVGLGRTSAELAKASHSSEATVTRLCHKLGYANYRKFQLELARDVLEQQETEARKRPNDPLHQALLDLQNNRQEEVQATIQALNLVQLRKVLSILRAAEIIEIEANGSSLPVAMDASLKLGSLGKRCMISPVPEKAKSFSSALTPKMPCCSFPAQAAARRWRRPPVPPRRTAHRSSSSPATSARRWQATPAIPCWPPTASSALPAICCRPSFRQRWWWRRSTTCWWAISI